LDLGLENKVALIAGGSSGMGLAAAMELAREGAHVAIGARDPARLQDAGHRLREIAKGSVHTTSVDITDLEAAKDWVDAVAAEFGALHIVLVSGGSPPFGPISGIELGAYRAAVEQVLMTAANLSLAAVPYMKEAGWGRLLYLASETASVPVAPLALSGIGRGALVRFAQAMAADLGKDGITVNVLAPGGTRTPPMERIALRLAEELEEGLAILGRHNALGRLARPEEIGAFAAFLASERASFVTGIVHAIDGGAGVTAHDLPYLGLLPKT